MAEINIYCNFKEKKIRASARKLVKQLRMRANDDTVTAYTNICCLDSCKEETCDQRSGYQTYLENPNT